MNIQEIINALKEVDGETMEHIIREVGMEDQMLRQLVMKAKEEEVGVLLFEKVMLDRNLEVELSDDEEEDEDDDNYDDNILIQMGR